VYKRTRLNKYSYHYYCYNYYYSVVADDADFHDAAADAGEVADDDDMPVLLVLMMIR
jgi:hypothetical protein